MEKLSQGKPILPAPIMLLFSEILLSALTEASNPNLIRL